MSPFAALKVLIAEDQQVPRTIAATFLGNLGVQTVYEASSGEQALSIAQERRPDIALVDLSMP